MTGSEVQKTTIFKQLILNIITPVVVALIILGVVNYRHNKRLLIESNKNKNDLITEQVKSILTFQDFALELLDENFNNQMAKFSDQLIHKYFVNTNDIQKVDLRAIQRELGMNPDLEDIYVINRKGIVVNTTFAKDMGLDFFSFGEAHKRHLLRILRGKKFVSERFSIEANTKRLKKYSYQPTTDHQYIIELGVYSDQATEVVEQFKKMVNEMSTKQSSVVSVDFFVGADNPVSFNNSNSVIQENQKEVFKKAFEEKKSQSVIEKSNGKDLVYEYIYMDRKNTDLYKGAVIRLVSDRSADAAVMRRELLTFFLVFGLTISILLALISLRARMLAQPIKKLVSNVNKIKEGSLSIRAEVEGNNEITMLSEHFNLMLEELESYYNELEQKVLERTAEISQQKEEIEAQRDHIEHQMVALEEKNESLQAAYIQIDKQKTRIMDSIHYAKRIQNAILPPDDFVKNLMPTSFVLYKPKDIVSGDFYWVSEKNGNVIFAAVDCTGHGVPGAFMSIVGNNNLNHAINDLGLTKPSDILDALNQGVTKVLRQKHTSGGVKDGMDIAICTIDFKAKKATYAGAFNPLVHVRNGVATQYKADKFPIGAFMGEELQKFSNNEVEIIDGDMLFVFSDGYKDQFGGEKDTKFMMKNFIEVLSKISHLSPEEQREVLDNTIQKWMGETKQIDDILVMGVKI